MTYLMTYKLLEVQTYFFMFLKSTVLGFEVRISKKPLTFSFEILIYRNSANQAVTLVGTPLQLLVKTNIESGNHMLST